MVAFRVIFCRSGQSVTQPVVGSTMDFCCYAGGAGRAGRKARPDHRKLQARARGGRRHEGRMQQWWAREGEAAARGQHGNEAGKGPLPPRILPDLGTRPSWAARPPSLHLVTGCDTPSKPALCYLLPLVPRPQRWQSGGNPDEPPHERDQLYDRARTGEDQVPGQR